MNTLPPEWYADNAPCDYDRHPRLDGKPRNIVIRPALPLWEMVLMCLVAVAIGVMIAVQI